MIDYLHDHLTEWEAWTGILDAHQAKQLVKTWAERSEDPQQERGKRDMAKSLFNVTMPSTLVVVVEASDEKSAVEAAAKKASDVFGASLGVLRVVGEAKVTPIGGGKADKSDKKSKKDDDEDDKDEEEEETDDEEEEEEEDEEEEEETDDEEEEEEEDEEEEEEKPSKKDKSDKKSDKGKSDKKDKSDGGGKKKIKIKLKG